MIDLAASHATSDGYVRVIGIDEASLGVWDHGRGPNCFGGTSGAYGRSWG